MDISAFVEEYDSSDDDNNNDDELNTESKNLLNFRNHLGKLVTKKKLRLDQYKKLLQFQEIGGSIKNINKWIKEYNDYDIIDNKLTINAFPGYFKNKKGVLTLNRKIYKGIKKLDGIKLTDEQIKGGKKVIKFIMDSNKATFGLYGYAGTGKTTTTVELISYLLVKGYINSVVFTAPTNKAVNVIKSQFRPHIKEIYEKISGKEINIKGDYNFENSIDKLYSVGVKVEFITTHKLLEFSMDYNSDGGLIFARNSNLKKKTSLMDRYELVIIDECSMLPLDIISAIFDDVKDKERLEGKIDIGSGMPKIIFTGDPAQLPPVNESKSFIFIKNENDLDIKEYCKIMEKMVTENVSRNVKKCADAKRRILTNYILNMDTFTLTNVVRSKIDTVTNICYEIRKWVNGEKCNPDLSEYIGETGAHFFDYNNKISKIETKWFKKCVKSVKKNKNSIILTWTNRQSDEYNRVVREKVFSKYAKNGKLEKFIQGDILMLTEFYCLDVDKNSDAFYTSDQIKVVKTGTITHKIKPFIFEMNKTIRIMKGFYKIESECNNFVRILNKLCENTVIECWLLGVQKLNSERNHMIRVMKDKHSDKLNYLKNDISSCIGGFAKTMLKKYSEKPKQIERLIIKPFWKQWHIVFVEPFANVNYGYAITCHKGQGSNFFNVFVDMDDIMKNNRETELKKCMYTAVTRTVNELFLLI